MSAEPDMSSALQGVRICDFTGQLAGAGATRWLASFGAEVIRIEDPVLQGRWDILRGAAPFKDDRRGIDLGGAFNNHNPNKLGITLNLRTEQAREILRRLVSVSDAVTENFAAGVLEKMASESEVEISQQLKDNLLWIKQAKENKLVVGSKARILYADSMGRIRIAQAFNEAIKRGEIGPVVLGRDHHDVSGTDSPFRETSNIYDGSQFTADMAIHNVIGDSFRGAGWVSIHNGGGVGWGEVINGGFGMLLEGTEESAERLEKMLFYDVNNGIARRSWAGNEGAQFAIQNAMGINNKLKVIQPSKTEEKLLNKLISD